MAQKIKTVAKEAAARKKGVKALLHDMKSQKSDICDLVKAVLWYGWYKVKGFSATLKGFSATLLRWVVYLFSFFVEISVCMVVFAAVAILSPLWYPFTMWWRPKWAAKFITKTRTDDAGKGFVAGVKFFASLIADFVFSHCMHFCWGWVWRFMPMCKRQHYIAGNNIELNKYDKKTQIEFFLVQDAEDKKTVIGELSPEGIDILWDEHQEVRSLILAKKPLNEKWADDLLVSEDECMRKILLNFVYDADKSVDEKVIKLFLAKMEGSSESVATRALEALGVYTVRHTLNAKMLRKLIVLAGTGNEHAERVLSFYVERTPLNADLLEEVFATGNEALVRKMKSLSKKHADISMVKATRDVWLAFCQVEQNVAPEAQRLMSWQQYHVFKDTGHKLDRAALKALLMSLNSQYIGFFEDLCKNEFEQIDEELKTLLCTEVWKQNVYDKVATAKQAEA